MDGYDSVRHEETVEHFRTYGQFEEECQHIRQDEQNGNNWKSSRRDVISEGKHA